MSPERDKAVLIALPAKDEERKIGPVLDKIRLYFPGRDVLIVDDGSTDGTARVAAERRVLLVHHDRNYGYARALQSAREFALSEGYQGLVLCDADGQHEPRDIGKIIEALSEKKADYVIASRELGSAPHGDPFIHKYGRKLYSALVSLWFYPAFRMSITDSSSGFKGWSRRAMRLFDEIFRTTNRLHDGRINDLEELFIVARNRLKILEVPARFYKRADDYSRIYADYGISGSRFRFKDFYYVFFSWPGLFVRTILRNVFR
jgi:glycosyltransferase involved in cell wall biosynthesis